MVATAFTASAPVPKKTSARPKPVAAPRAADEPTRTAPSAAPARPMRTVAPAASRTWPPAVTGPWGRAADPEVTRAVVIVGGRSVGRAGRRRKALDRREKSEPERFL